jgi:penicillin G amidase
MDLLRRRASGTLAEVMGESQLKHDIQMRRLGIRRGCETLWASDDLPAEFRAEMEAYADGVNARIRLRAPEGFGVPFAMLGYEPTPWTPVDSLVFLKYMGWDQSGTDDDLWLGQMVAALGPEAVAELWPLDRPFERGQITTVSAEQAAAFGSALDALDGALSPRGYAFGSNNWAVAGSRTRSGKPILCSDPHLGFTLPSLWYAVHVSVKGENVAGVTFPVSPHVVIGHNDVLGWGITNLQADAVDYFIETRSPSARDQYQHKGEWKTFETRTESIPVQGQDDHIAVFESTVHGPVVTHEPETISMQWTGFGPTAEAAAFWKMNRAQDFDAWYAAAQEIVVPGINLAYADADGTIALYAAGAFPKRAHGAGRVPMDGASGEHDWVEMIPRTEMPLALNPDSGFVASANARPADEAYPHYLGWMWDVSYRLRRIRQVLSDANDVTVDDMRALQFDVVDVAAQRFLPAMLREIEGEDFESTPHRRAVEALKNWDYRATLDAPAPTIWLRWLDHYRKAVWDPQWSSRNMEKGSGSWGFSGINRREPMLDVLEQMTRREPDSPWFDDPKTEWVETRKDRALSSFITAMGTLERQFGRDIDGWAWRNTNVLRINSIYGDDTLRRTGDSVPGTMFTVNPGGDIGPVGGGASWRMIVDFSAPGDSIGVYPGGQSGDADSPHYDDLMALWARGDYLPLRAVSDAAELPEAVRENVTTFAP